MIAHYKPTVHKAPAFLVFARPSLGLLKQGENDFLHYLDERAGVTRHKDTVVRAGVESRPTFFLVLH